MQIGNSSLFTAYSAPHRAEPSPAAATENKPAESSQQSQGSASRVLDFISMTRSDLRNTVNSLIVSGKLSLADSSGLIGITGPPITTSGGLDTSAATDGAPVDALASLRTGIAGATSRHDDRTAAVLTRTLTALERLQGTSTGVDLRI